MILRIDNIGVDRKHLTIAIACYRTKHKPSEVVLKQSGRQRFWGSLSRVTFTDGSRCQVSDFDLAECCEIPSVWDPIREYMMQLEAEGDYLE